MRLNANLFGCQDRIDLGSILPPKSNVLFCSLNSNLFSGLKSNFLLCLQQNMQETPDPLDSDDDYDTNPYEPTPAAAPTARQPTHYELTPSPGLGPSMFSNRTQQQSQGTVLVPNSSPSTFSSSLQAPPCGQPLRSAYNSPRTRYYPSSLGPGHHSRRNSEGRSSAPQSRELSGSPNIPSTYPSSLGFGHHSRWSSESRASTPHSRQLSGSPNISSTQGTDLNHEILWIQDEYAELRDSQLRMMEHVLHLTQKLDRLSSEFFQSQKPLSTHQLVGTNIRWAK